MNGNLSDPIGQQIAHYVIERRIGGGAMASVYQATDEILDRTIALKVLLPGADALTRKRFRQEARTVSILDHPHIVRTLQVGQTAADGVAYIAMDLIEGKSLSTLLDELGTIPIATACAILEPVARALAYAHSLGVVHRDVKPSNILLRLVDADTQGAFPIREGEPETYIPYLSDFGIARALDSPELTSAGRTIGTPAYMAPEQCAGSREIDGRADIYSLGTVLYRCLVGRPPFIGTTTQILHAHVYEPLMIPDDILRDLPSAVIDALRRSLMKEPELRYKDASEMADALATVVEQYEAEIGYKNKTGYGRRLVDELAPTRTIPIMSATGDQAEDSGSTSHTLIPGLSANKEPKPGSTTQNPVIFKPQTGSTTHQRVARPLPQASKRQTNWIGIAIGITLLLLLIYVGTALMGGLLPTADGLAFPNTLPEQPQAVEMQTDVAFIGSVADETEDLALAIVTPTALAGPSFITQTFSSSITSPSLITESVSSAPTESAVAPGPTETPTSPPTSTPTPLPTPTFNAVSWFEDTEALFQERDWELVRDNLTYLRRIDSEFRPEVVNTMLTTSYIGLGVAELVRKPFAQEISEEQIANAVLAYRGALEVNGKLPTLDRVVSALEAWLDAPAAEKEPSRSDVTEALADLASELASQGDSCSALEQITVALRLKYENDLAQRQNDLLEACPDLQEMRIRTVEVDRLSGHIFYSSLDAIGMPQIRRVSLENEAESEQIVSGGRQPSISPDGSLMAFRSDLENRLGIRGYVLSSVSQEQQSPYIQFTYNAEDSLASPPTWSPAGDRLIFESTVSGDRVPRLYFADNNSSGQYRLIADGREPDWHPTEDLIVYKGADATGNRPGLWLMTSSGAGRRALTENSGDTRPVWSPDGRYVVFMSNTRHESEWDIYRLELETLEILRLTRNSAQDGLPAVSPDSQHVAFLSNRDDDLWKIFVVPIQGGVAQSVITVSGTLPNWLEHSIQWVK